MLPLLAVRERVEANVTANRHHLFFFSQLHFTIRDRARVRNRVKVRVSAKF